ncbi:MAG: hypothetical protein GXP42_16910 [Chloroflexi bacterium]|nr:hypothetical protein [Chloroflexota bacterium]
MTTRAPEALVWGVRRYLAARGAEIRAVHRQPFQGGLSGSALEYWHLSLRRAGMQTNMTVVYKRGKTVEGAFMRGAARREVMAYAHLPERIPLGMPTVVAFDAVTGDLWLLPFPPVKHTNHWLADWDEADVRRTLDDLAKLHAAFWDARDALAQWPWLRDPLGREAEALLAEGRASLECIQTAKAFDQHLTPDRVARLMALAKQPNPLFQALTALPPTLLHGDAGFQNVAITQDGRRRLWYDWQLVGFGPATLDLVTYLHPWAYPDANPPLSLETMTEVYLERLAQRGHVVRRDAFTRALDAALLWRWLVQWAPLLGQYRERLRPTVLERLYAAFERLHWPALIRGV